MGMAAPILVALFAIPLLIEGMGKDRFGLLTIIWMGVGYFSLFDLGLGRALTKMVAERLGKNELSDLGPLIWTTFLLLLILGGVATLVVIALAVPLVSILSVPEAMRDEALAAFYILGGSLPIVIITSGLIGLLEAYQRFDLITVIRIPLGILTFVAPLLTLQYDPSIALATAALLLSRFFALGAYYIAVSQVCDELKHPQKPQRKLLSGLFKFGGWLTVTNIVGPLMTYLDRFFVGAILGLSSVAYYVTPYEVLSRLQILSQAIMGVLFPAMATAHAGEKKRFVDLYAHARHLVFWLMLPVTASAFLLAPEALAVWLGEDFKDASTTVVQWLALGWIINALAKPAFTALQTTGCPDLVAKSHLAELIPYLFLLWWLSSLYGIAGTAATWTLRVAADTLILNLLAAMRLPELRTQVFRTLGIVALTLIGFAAFWLLDDLLWRLLMLIVMSLLSLMMLWPLAVKAFGTARRLPC